MQRRLLVTVVLVVVTLVLLPVATNLVTSAVPEWVKPYLWLTWPAIAVLVVVVALMEVRRARLAPTHPGTTGMGGHDGRQLSSATEQLAETIYRQWSDEAAIRMLHRPQPLYLRWSSTGPAGCCSCSCGAW